MTEIPVITSFREGISTSQPDPLDPQDPQEPRVRMTMAERVNRYGLFVAPFLIGLIALGLYLYYQSLDLENAVIQQRNALDWDTRLLPQAQQQIIIAAWSTLLVIAVAVPLGILLTRPVLRRISPAVLTVANAGQAMPAYGLLVIGLIIGGPGRTTSIVVLAVFALLPVLRNTMVGLDGVERPLLEAGRGMGMTRLGVLLRIELPLAVPVIIAGIRTAMIINIGMATLVFLIGGGALGVTINSGLKNQQEPVYVIGAVMVALIALSFDWLGALAERYLRPKGV
ncbi:ABC transporter permease [uncultured Nocardioides sp.]|uniref:ABC transporter permease n=1 Tax=uncultured Nocardioides sp. TaxID=198441 RepID=UPI000C3CFB00|nr:glycine/betaine ABC transporter permease [Nocardioides sp.]|tara:strand:- start:1328 stop:2176 length:849 start_codon:yes stop_codon:yes gene_type:complete